MIFDIEVGDLVHARQATELGTVIAEFIVTAIDDHTVSGGPLGDIELTSGWTLELCRKGDPALPESLSILAAWTIQDQSLPVKIIGPDEGIWRDTSGNRIYPQDVLGWLHWADHTPPVDDVD